MANKSQRHPATPAAPATPPPPPQWHPLNWAFPFAPKSGNAADPQTWLHALAGADGGFYPLATNGMFHGGIHFDAGTGSDLKQDDGVKVIADGEVVAYRLDSTYPELTYPTTPPHYALYSSSFVLVRHKLVLPPEPDKSKTSASSTAPASASSTPAAAGLVSAASATGASSPQEYQPPADDVLEFYSLYMHQLDWAGFKAAQSDDSSQASVSSIRSLPFWQGEKHFCVGNKANDSQAQPPQLNTPFRFDLASSNSDHANEFENCLPLSGEPTGAPNNIGSLVSYPDRVRYAVPSGSPAGALQGAEKPQVGIRIRDRASGTIIGLLPRGSELRVTGNATSGWAQIATIISGTPLAAIAGGTPDARAMTGWVHLGELDPVIEPKPLDAVVVLDTPFKVNAGDVVGYLGEYTNSTQAHKLPPKPTRPLLHVEVFTGAQMTDFITRSKKRANKLPDSAKTLLVIQRGAKFVNPAESKGSAQLTGTKLVLAKDTKSAKGDPGKGYWAKVQPTQYPDPGNSHGSARSNQSGKSRSSQHHQPTGTSVGNPLWVIRTNAGQDYSPAIQTWTEFPLQLANAQGAAVGYQQVLSRAQLDQLKDADKATDDQGTQWWSITAGDSDGKTIDGWVCEKSHSNTEWQSPWSWPGFDTVDTTDIPLLDMYRRTLFVKKQLFDGEEKEFSAVAATVNASPFIGQLEKAVKQQGGGQGNVVPADLKNALTVRWLAEAVSHLIFRYESEWGGEMSKWEKFLPIMGDGKPTWKSEMERIKKLQWWGEVKGVPADPNVWHIHPIGLVGNFVQAGCSCNKDITEQELDLLLPVDVKLQGLFHAAHVTSVRGFNKGKFLDLLNKYMRENEIMTCLRKVHFLSQMSHECDSLRTNEEYRNKDGSVPSGWKNYQGGSNFHGRGLIQLTHDKNYIAYGNFINDLSIGSDPDTVSHSIDHTVHSACWYWRHGSHWGDINPKSDKNDFYAITVAVNGGFNHVEDRFIVLNKLAQLLGAEKCTTNPGLSFSDYQVEKSALCGTNFYKSHQQRIKEAVEAVNDKKTQI